MHEPPRSSSIWKGTAGLVVAIATVVVLLVLSPAYRIFFGISLGLAFIVAVVLYYWHKLRPVRPEDVDDKRPLKLR